MFRKKLVSEWPRNYGTSCAPFLAVRVLEHFAVDHQEEQLYFKNPTKGYLRRWYSYWVKQWRWAIVKPNRVNSADVLRKSWSWNMVSNTSFIQTKDTNAQFWPDKVLELFWYPGRYILTYNEVLAANPDSTNVGYLILSDSCHPL